MWYNRSNWLYVFFDYIKSVSKLLKICVICSKKNDLQKELASNIFMFTKADYFKDDIQFEINHYFKSNIVFKQVITNEDLLHCISYIDNKSNYDYHVFTMGVYYNILLTSLASYVQNLILKRPQESELTYNIIKIIHVYNFCVTHWKFFDMDADILFEDLITSNLYDVIEALKTKFTIVEFNIRALEML